MNVQNIQYDNELNLRLQKRNIPDSHLRPLFDFRPTPTKYTLFNTLEDSVKSKETLFTYSNYSPSSNFNPSQKGSTHFYFQSIDEESKLQNRFMALQKADQAVYVPELTSSLYEDSMAYQKNSYYYDNVNYESRKLKYDLAPSKFYNHTKTNLKNITK
jgi:hypothetical protein